MFFPALTGFFQEDKMDFKSGEIVLAPKNISWVGMPLYMSDKDRFELLKHDIFIHNCEPEYVTGVSSVQNEKSACLFNLDSIIRGSKRKRFIGPVPISIQLARYIRDHRMHHGFVHTTMLDRNIASVFRDFRIPFVQKDMQFRKTAWSYLYAKVIPLLTSGRKPREFVRLKFFPQIKVVAGIEVLNRGYRPKMTAFLKDISLNGMGLVLRDPGMLKYFQLGDFLRITMFSHDLKLKLTSSFLTRVDKESLELGVRFNIDDELFIRRNDAQQLMRLIYSSLKEITHQIVLYNQSTEYRML